MTTAKRTWEDAEFNTVNAAAKDAGYVILKKGARDANGHKTRFWMRDADGAKLIVVESNPMPLF